MNFLDAAKSNRPFKRKEWDIWVEWNDDQYEFLYNVNMKLTLSLEDVHACDWEIKEDIVELPWSKVLKVYALGYEHGIKDPILYSEMKESQAALTSLKRELGFS